MLPGLLLNHCVQLYNFIFRFNLEIDLPHLFEKAPMLHMN